MVLHEGTWEGCEGDVVKAVGEVDYRWLDGTTVKSPGRLRLRVLPA